MTSPRAPARLASTLLVMGKGGVGKTTIAAALAVLETQLRGRAVLVEFGDGSSGVRALGRSAAGVEHLVVKPDEAIQRGAAPLFGSATLARMALDNFAMRPLLRAAPAIREIAMLESIRQIAAERPGVRVVVDMPATGHGVAWLRTARQGRDFLTAGPLFDLCDRVARELVAPGRASPVVVTLPERLVLEETLELCADLARDPGLPVGAIVVNRVPLDFGRPAREAAVALRGTVSGALLEPLIQLLEAREAASVEANAALQGGPLQLDARGVAHPATPAVASNTAVWRLPLAPTDPSAVDAARWLQAEGAS